MSAAHDTAQKFLDALAANDAAAFEGVLAEEAGLRRMGWDGTEAHRPRERVVGCFQTEWSA